MSEVRSLLKSERAARRIQHKYASYSAAGTLLCLVCHLQLKSEVLWDGHLRSTGHVTRLQKLQNGSPSPTTADLPPQSKKRKASFEEGAEDREATVRKRSRPANGLPEGFFNPGAAAPIQHHVDMQMPSRPATPLKSSPTDSIPRQQELAPHVDEDEWAAFEADIAAAEVSQLDNDVVISAPAMTAEEVKKKSAEEEFSARKERQEAEMEGDKEDAARKMEEELEQMESLEARVKRLREKREELRRRDSLSGLRKPESISRNLAASVMEEDDEDDSEEDDWDGFRMR